MRTTVTLDPDVEELVRRRMRERGVSFTKAINDLVRDGAWYEGSGAKFFGWSDKVTMWTPC
jgi:hypothetical protein